MGTNKAIAFRTIYSMDKYDFSIVKRDTPFCEGQGRFSVFATKVNEEQKVFTYEVATGFLTEKEGREWIEQEKIRVVQEGLSQWGDYVELLRSDLVPKLEGKPVNGQMWEEHSSNEQKWELWDGVPFSS